MLHACVLTHFRGYQVVIEFGVAGASSVQVGYAVVVVDFMNCFTEMCRVARIRLSIWDELFLRLLSRDLGNCSTDAP